MTESSDPSSPRPEPDAAPALDPVPALEPRRSRLRWWVWLPLAVLVVVVGVASRIDLNYYALAPGSAQSVQPFISVPPARSHPVTHPVLLTDVQIGRVTALTYLYFKLQKNTILEKVAAVTGGTAPSELGAQGALQMTQAEDAAKAAALTRLGYRVAAVPSGAVITGTFAGTPAYGVLAVGDVVTAVDGTPTPTADAFGHAMSRYHSGQRVTLTVRKGGSGAPGPVQVTLKRTVVITGLNAKGQVQRAALDLGVVPADQVNFTYPVPVRIDVTNIGGPSAGLAMTLGVIDALSTGSLTGGRTVAATGTIDAQGDVGDVGGVAQKTVAVEGAGASIFLVPPQEYRVALSKDRPGLKIYAVSTLDQALQILAAHGGKVPPAPATAGAQAAAAG
jgi:Lon-like protease